MRKHARFFLWAGLAALALRLFFVFASPAVVDDSRLYGNIAKNWLQHGVFGITNSGRIMPTLSRLPGYPAFLAAIFAIFGADNFRAVLLIQVGFDLATCLLVADMARRLFSERAAMAAFLLAGLCPFLAEYAATALTECLEIFFTALALDFAMSGFGRRESSAVASWLGCGLSVGACILLRPDGGILLVAIGGYLLLCLGISAVARLSPTPKLDAKSLVRAGLILVVASLAPLIPWTLRNLHTMHRFEPLAPRYANDADEPITLGFNHWVRTWIADYVSVEEIYWNVPGDAIDVTRLPNRAFDSPAQRRQTVQLFADYNRDKDITPEIDSRFDALAVARVHDAPFRYYLWLPALRIADMWLRPRTELLNADPRWWEFNDAPGWLVVSLGFGVLNLFYLVLAAVGWLRAPKALGVNLLTSFLVLRSLFLGTLENPEPRYTLECYPVVIILAAAIVIVKSCGQDRKSSSLIS